ncbi:putative C2H2 finger domain protein [Paraphoma chrysanthemicola]|nr:putative C2H2 finger domain protein [Paraphoma chrysanthemicola]
MDSIDDTTSSQHEGSLELPSSAARRPHIDYAHNAFQLPPPSLHKYPVVTSQWSQTLPSIASLGYLLTSPNDNQPPSPPPPSPNLFPVLDPVFSNAKYPSGQHAIFRSHPDSMPRFNSADATAIPHLPGLPPYHFPIANDRPFKCDQCPESFNRNHDLKRHKRIHLAVKPFPCNHCDKSFSRKDALKRHILVRGCGKVSAHPDETTAEAAAPKEAEWIDTSDIPRSPQSEPPTPTQKQEPSIFKTPDQKDDEDLYT